MLDHAQRAQSLHDVGFRLDTLTSASLLLTPLAAVVIALVAIVGHLSGSARFPAGSAAALSLAKLIAFGVARCVTELNLRRTPEPDGQIAATAKAFYDEPHAASARVRLVASAGHSTVKQLSTAV